MKDGEPPVRRGSKKESKRIKERLMGKGCRRLAGKITAIWVVFAVLCAVLANANPVEAQVKGSIISVGIGGNAGKDGVYREGSWVPVQVQIKNMTPAAFVGRLGVTQLDLDGDKAISMGPEFVLQPGVEERTLWTYYWPRPDRLTQPGGIGEVAIYDKSGPIAKLSIPNYVPGSPGNALAIAPDDDSLNKLESVKRSTRFVLVLGDTFAGWRSFEGMWGGTEAVRPVLVKANQLPDDVKGLDGVDLIVWEADSVKVSDVPAEFQLKAILEWVRAGGHLVVSVGTQGQEFAKAPAALQAAMPLAITGETREIRPTDMKVSRQASTLWTYSHPDPGMAPPKSVVQVVGEMKPGSRPMAATFAEPFADHPIAVTGMYGRGAVTVVTFNVANPDFKLPDEQSIEFWDEMAGWQGGFGLPGERFATSEEFTKNKNAFPDDRDARRFVTSAREKQIGKEIPIDIDVKDVTVVRILVAFLFLALYWLIAGPVGHLILRQYKVVHWSWWIFGGVVLAATAIAGTVVLVLHVNAYDVRHRSFVIGTVNSPEVTVSSYYGVYAPVSGPLKISQPASAGELNYLVPLCVPSEEDVKSFADPQSYDVPVDASNADETIVSPVFRNTLKKLQGRWTGQMGKVEGTADFDSASTDLRHLLKGKLTNNSGYDLQDANVVVYLPRLVPQALGNTYLFHVNSVEKGLWKKGETVTLENLQLDELEPSAPRTPGTVELALSAIAWKNAPNDGIGHFNMQGGIDDSSPQFQALINRNSWRDDLLYVLLDQRSIDKLTNPRRVEPVRGPGRLTDCTKLLHVGCGLIVAHSGDDKNPAKSPVPLKVNDKEVTGKGEVVFAWALPIGGKVPNATLMSNAAAVPAVQPPASRRGGVIPGPEANQ